MYIKVIVLLACALTSSVLAWPYGEQKIRGVNAGSWLVLERWMNSEADGVFAGLPEEVTDEYKLCEYLGPEAAEQRMKNHWATWVTEADFEFWASTGLNHIRLPIGYWALDIQEGEPWVNGSWDYVLKAAEWSKKYGLQLMIDLHGAPGSQNGWDHSGRTGAIEFFTEENIQRTVNVLGQIAQWTNLPEWKETVTVISVLNEPTLWDDYDYRLERLKYFYDLAYDEIRRNNDIVVVAIHDAFIDYSNWYYFGEPRYYSVLLDVHLYQVFGDDWSFMSCEQHYQHPCNLYGRLAAAEENLWTVVGEWSLDTPGELNCDRQDYFASQQIGVYETATSGWIMWAHFNGANMQEWSFKHSYDNHWIDPAGNNTPQCSALEPSTSSPSSTTGSVLSWPYGEQKIRGVNAGSWLVLERWMNSEADGVFSGIPGNVTDEYKLCEYLGPEAAEQRMKNHWATWVTEADFAFWASTGLNHIRLPIGYWALDIQEGEPWVNGSWDYVLKAAEWSKKYGLQLMIDLHGAPGSQNGWDHSGRTGASDFFTEENIQRTVNVLGQIAQWTNLPEWKETVTVISVLNEPTLWDDYDYRLERLKYFYDLAYFEIRKYNDLVVVTIHDAFIDYSNWYYFDDPKYYSVMLDVHLYQVFGDEWPLMSCEEHYQHPCSYLERLEAVNERLWTVVGEWSLATPAELSCDGQDYFSSQQIGVFESAASGWIMWAHFNGANMQEWSFKHSYDNHWIDPAGNNTPQCSALEPSTSTSATSANPPITSTTTSATTSTSAPTSTLTSTTTGSATSLYSSFVFMLVLTTVFMLLAIR